MPPTKTSDDGKRSRKCTRGRVSRKSSAHSCNNSRLKQEGKHSDEENQRRTFKKRHRNHQRRTNDRKKQIYPDYTPMDDCIERYLANDSSIVRGKLRVLPGGSKAFVSCDRGLLKRDVFLANEVARNRAMDGDEVFVEIQGIVEQEKAPVANANAITNEERNECDETDISLLHDVANSLRICDEDCKDQIFRANDQIEDDLSNETEDDVYYEEYDISEEDEGNETFDGSSTDECSDRKKDYTTWQDDEVQASLWNPVLSIRKNHSKANKDTAIEDQFYGIVIQIFSRTSTTVFDRHLDDHRRLSRTIVGTLIQMGGSSTRFLLAPSNRSLPRFMTPKDTQKLVIHQLGKGKDLGQLLVKAEYNFGTWSSTDKWPPCVNVTIMGLSCNIEDETTALLASHGVDHGEFSQRVLKDVQDSVRSGQSRSCDGEIGWEPTPEMYTGRRDYRHERIFTIDPTTAKDLDDALHIKELPDGRVEIGVHIADVSHFVRPDLAVDDEAKRRATTIYLVDRTIPMLPRPLCEIACSLNENVERLAMSCVWKMNADGTLATKGKSEKNDVWYGRTIIKSCARLDYTTAQNIIEKKVANDETEEVNEALWPKHRQPVGHTLMDVAKDVRLMHKVAMARRRLRFQNGALGLNGIKMAFELENEGGSPSLCEPYPIRDSNRLVEEYMLIANYLVAQRLITHAGGLAILRHHPSPLQNGINNVVELAKESMNFRIDGSSSQRLQDSLSRMSMECDDELVMQCITELLMIPMKPAEYIAAGQFDEDTWKHFALNIPYYTHFTSPIRRYPDVMVHRLLKATIDGQNALKEYPLTEDQIQKVATHCNEKRAASKKAQERSERIFLSLFLKANPATSVLGLVLSVGEKAFNVFVPDFGLSGMVYIEDHFDVYDVVVTSERDGTQTKRTMTMKPKDDGEVLVIKTFAKLDVSCSCKMKPPIDISLRVLGPWLR